MGWPLFLITASILLGSESNNFSIELMSGFLRTSNWGIFHNSWKFGMLCFDTCIFKQSHRFAMILRSGDLACQSGSRAIPSSSTKDKTLDYLRHGALSRWNSWSSSITGSTFWRRISMYRSSFMFLLTFSKLRSPLLQIASKILIDFCLPSTFEVRYFSLYQ